MKEIVEHVLNNTDNEDRLVYHQAMTEPVETFQLYNEQGQPIPFGGQSRDILFEQALLHGASHVWIWRNNSGITEVLLQKRSSTKPNWPDYFDISAAGHMDDGEDPITAAVRETEEEIGIKVNTEDLTFIGVHRTYMPVIGTKWIENELQFLYILEIDPDSIFQLQDEEVGSLIWKPLEVFKKEIKDPSKKYVPHGDAYYLTIINEVEKSLAQI